MPKLCTHPKHAVPCTQPCPACAEECEPRYLVTVNSRTELKRVVVEHGGTIDDAYKIIHKGGDL